MLLGEEVKHHFKEEKQSRGLLQIPACFSDIFPLSCRKGLYVPGLLTPAG